MRTPDPLARRRVVVGLLSWLLFAAAWLVVARRAHGHVVTPQLLVLPASVVAVLAVTLMWIRHNEAIYRRKGPRRGVPVMLEPPVRDRLGRSVRLDRTALQRAQEVVVELVDDAKTYRAVR